MGSGEYAMVYGTIDFALTEIADGMSRHDFGLVSDETYHTWTTFTTYKGEENKQIGKRRRFTAHFEDEDGHKWDVVTYKCVHTGYLSKGNCWRFIDRIKCDGKIIAKPNITIAAYEKNVEKAKKKAEFDAERFSRLMMRFMME